MVKYIFNRFVASVFTIWVVITLTFFLMRFLPGGPFDGERNIAPAIKANMEAKFGMDKPIATQYVTYMGNLLHGDLGPSMLAEGKSVNQIINKSFPVSARLGLIAVLVALVAGVNMGIVSALKQDHWQDRSFMVLATMGVTVPSFVMADLLIYFFAVKLRWLPVTGLTTSRHYIMPAIALAGYSMAFITRLTRSRLVDVMTQDYIRTAKAKGLSRSAVIFKHALRNSMIPVVTYLGPLVAGVLTGSFVIERIFAIPGLGREFITSISNRDYTLTLGVTVFYCSFVIIMNFLVDLIYVVIDPRIKLTNSEG